MNVNRISDLNNEYYFEPLAATQIVVGVKVSSLQMQTNTTTKKRINSFKLRRNQENLRTEKTDHSNKTLLGE